MSSKEPTPITIIIQPDDNYMDILVAIMEGMSRRINSIHDYDARKRHFVAFRMSILNLVEALDHIYTEQYTS